MIKLYILLVVVGLLGGVGYGAYYYYVDTQDRIRILTENNAKLATAKLIQDNTINAMVEDRDKFQRLNSDLQSKIDKANGRLRKHNLVALSLKDPELVEKKINNGTKKLLRSLEVISGAAPITPAK